MVVKTLKWPFLVVLISGTLHFALIAIFPDLQNFYTPPVLGLVQLAIGIWLGYASAHNGGNFLTAIMYAALLGLFPLIVYPLSFRYDLRRRPSHHDTCRCVRLCQFRLRISRRRRLRDELMKEGR